MRNFDFERYIGVVLPVVAMVENSPGSEADRKVKKTWGKAVEAQALSIGSLRAAYAPGEPILLKVCFRTCGEKDVKVVYADPLGLYQVSVLLPDGKPATLTLFGIQRESGPRVSVLPRDGKPARLRFLEFKEKPALGNLPNSHSGL